MSSEILACHNITKSFYGTTALEKVNFSVMKREIVGLVGENGAGKSTLMKIIVGLHQPDEGVIYYEGEEIKISSIKVASNYGIGIVFQEQSLLPNLKVTESMFLGHEEFFRNLGFLRLKEMEKEASIQLQRLHVQINPNKYIRDLTQSQRQLIEIARVLWCCKMASTENPIIILDEPTTVLNQEELKSFFALLEALKSEASIILISHRLEEILEHSDRIFILKDGSNVFDSDASKLSKEDVYRLMVGKEMSQDYYKVADQADAGESTAIRISGLERKGFFYPTTFGIKKGEILSIMGLFGSGKEDLCRCIAGVSNPDGGKITLGECNIRLGSPLEAVKNGIGYVPSDRRLEGLALQMNVKQNLTLAVLDKIFALGLLSTSKENKIASDWSKKLRIKAESLRSICAYLSGGNQQKIVLAKWLAAEVKVLILDHPTRGIDVGTKEEIYGVIRALAKESIAILLMSDTFEEDIGLCNRAIMMKDGRVNKEIACPSGSKPTILEVIKYL